MSRFGSKFPLLYSILRTLGYEPIEDAEYITSTYEFSNEHIVSTQIGNSIFCATVSQNYRIIASTGILNIKGNELKLIEFLSPYLDESHWGNTQKIND